MSLHIKKKHKNTLAAVIFITAAFYGCSNPNNQKKEIAAQEHFFDIPGFFQKEIDSLTAANPSVNKTVKKDDTEETKNLKIKDWNVELSSFYAIDLNKPAYAGYVKVDSADSVIQYSFSNPDLDLSCVRIKLDNLGQPEMISVEKEVRNTLYKTSEFLVYEKNKFYLVEKNQQVKVMGDNYYKVQGEF